MHCFSCSCILSVIIINQAKSGAGTSYIKKEPTGDSTWDYDYKDAQNPKIILRIVIKWNRKIRSCVILQRMDLNLDCENKNLSFTMFIRQLIEIPEDFTVGLRLNTPNPYNDYAVVLLRFQGPHGGQSIEKTMIDLHNQYHVHLYTQDDFEHRRKKASVSAKQLAEFNSFEEAICSFLDYCNVDDPNDIFTQERQNVLQFKMNLEL